MTIALLAHESRSVLKAADRRTRRPSYVAVACFGQDAARMLPLAPGSRLVVDASEGSVGSGQTCPAELAKPARRGVRVEPGEVVVQVVDEGGGRVSREFAERLFGAWRP